MTPLVFFGFVSLLVIGVPITFAVASVVFIPLAKIGIPLTVIPQRLFGTMDSFTLLAIPFFILAGDLMDATGISETLVNLAKTLVGHFRGGLGMVVVVSEYLFSGISGSAVADTAAVGSIVIPSMERNGYTRQKATGIVCGACAMGILVPPSISMVVYGGLTNISIAALFAAGFLPAFIPGVILMLQLYYEAKRANLPAQKRASFKEFLIALKKSFWALLMPVIIFGGILGGIFTPTESAVVAVVYALLVGVFIYRKITLSVLTDVFMRTAQTTGIVMLLIAASSILAWYLTIQEVPRLATDYLIKGNVGSITFLFIVILLFLFLGCIMEGIAAMIMVVPLLMPIFKALNIDTLHAGIIIVATVGIGLFTPPVGAALFVACSIGKITIEECTKAMAPYLITVTVCILLMVFFPQVVTIIPKVLGLIK